MSTEPEQQATDAFEELAAATKAVATARRKLAIADDRLRDAMANYLGHGASGDRTPDRSPARERIIDRVASVIRAADGASVTAGAICRATGDRSATLKAICSLIVRDPTSGIVRVKKGVFAYIPDQAANVPATR